MSEDRRMTGSVDFDELWRGDLKALARALSCVERGGAAGAALAAAARARRRASRRVVVTGPPGVGKSTLLRAVLEALRARGERAAVLACDPSSTRTGGAFLGDRVRWAGIAADPGVFIRSMAHRGEEREVAQRVDAMAAVLEAAGWPWVFLETVGAGQRDAPGLAGATLVLVLSPACGDEIQMLKAGVLEKADIFVVNRTDLPGGERWAQALEDTLRLSGAAPPVLRVAAATGAGVEDLLARLVEHSGSPR
jgi:LAO/AO transport system kinase